MKIASNQIADDYLLSSNTINADLVSGAGFKISTSDSSNFTIEKYNNFDGIMYRNMEARYSTTYKFTGLLNNTYFDVSGRFPFPVMGKTYWLDEVFTTESSFTSYSGDLVGKQGLVVGIRKNNTGDPNLYQSAFDTFEIGGIVYNTADAYFVLGAKGGNTSTAFWVWENGIAHDEADNLVANELYYVEMR